MTTSYDTHQHPAQPFNQLFCLCCAMLCCPAVVAEEETDPNSAEVDGLGFLVEDADEGADDEELDPADIEFVEDIPAEVRHS